MSGPSKCPICGKPVEGQGLAVRFAPFCSGRCADLDLGRWLKGGYAIPGAATEDESSIPDGPPGGGQAPDEE